MQLRRVVTVYTIALGVPLLMLGSAATPGAVRPTSASPERPMESVALPTQTSTLPAHVTVTLSTPEKRTVRHVRLGHYDIPVTALMAYQRAADILAQVKPSCELPWTLLAAIGRVESDHGRYAGATLSPDGVSSPRVVGVALDGQGPVAAIRDTDHGRWDGDPTWDHAVGPMQFLPSTWRLVGVDADGDGTRSINDIDDAALAAGVYLCAGAGQGLTSRTAMEQAVLRYNDSTYYAALVLAYESKYRGGDFKVVTPRGGVPESTAVLAGPALGGPLTPGPGVGPGSGTAVKARVKVAVRDALTTTKRHHGTTNQRKAAGRTTAAGTVSDASTGARTGQAAGKTSGKSSSGTSGTSDASGAGAEPATSGGSSTSASGQAGSTGGGTSSSDNGSTSNGSTAGPAPASQDQSGPGTGTSDQPSGTASDSPSPSADGQDSTEQTPSPSPDPTPQPTTVTALLTEKDGAYFLGGRLLDLGTLATAGTTAVGDFDRDGSVETNGAELTGLVGTTVTMVVVERDGGRLGIYSINGIALA